MNFWRHESLPLPLEYLDDETLVDSLKLSLALAEDIASAALSAVRLGDRGESAFWDLRHEA